MDAPPGPELGGGASAVAPPNAQPPGPFTPARPFPPRRVRMSSAAFFRIHRDDRVFRLLFYRRCVSHRFRPRPQPRPSGPARCSPTAPRPGHAALVHVRPCPGRVRPSVPPQRARPWACAGTAGLPRALGLCELPPGSLAHAAGRAASAPRADAAKPELAGWFLRPVPEVAVTREGSSWLLLFPGTHRLPRSLGSNNLWGQRCHSLFSQAGPAPGRVLEPCLPLDCEIADSPLYEVLGARLARSPAGSAQHIWPASHLSGGGVGVRGWSP